MKTLTAMLLYSVFTAAFLLAKTQFQPVLAEEHVTDKEGKLHPVLAAKDVAYKDTTDKKGKLTFLTYGPPPGMTDYQRAKVAYHKYDLQIVDVAGCVVSERLVDSVRNHNALVDKLMIKRFGPKWHDSLQAQTAREYTFDTNLIKLVSNFDYVRERHRKLSVAGNGLRFRVDSNLDATTREIIAYGDAAGVGPPLVQHFLFKVNPKTREVLSVDKKAKGLEVEQLMYPKLSYPSP